MIFGACEAHESRAEADHCMPSLRSKLLVVILRLIGVKRDMHRLSERVAAGDRTRTEPTALQRMNFHVTNREVDGHTVWTIAPRTGSNGNSIIYLHGGVYVSSFASQHWDFITKLVQTLGCTVVAPNYPHAPEYDCRQTVDLVLRVYQETVAAAGSASRVTVMGDSSGGGIALSLAQRLRAEGLAQPANLILLSPWLDASLSNPEIPALDKIDPFLDHAGMQWAGRSYAEELDPANPLASPVNGALENLAPITLFIGTRDILLPDCRKLRDRAAAAGVAIEYHEYESMVHNWMLVPIPEAQQVFSTIAETLRDHGPTAV